MKPKEKKRAAKFKEKILEFHHLSTNLPGICPPDHLECLVQQLIDSRRRIEYANHLRDVQHDKDCMNPRSNLFDPLKAAVLHHRLDEMDEACWLIFMSTHFGKHHANGWRLTRDVYGRLGGPGTWNWVSISTGMTDFRLWLQHNQSALAGNKFTSHRRYQSLRADSDRGTAAVFESYVQWIDPPGTHKALIASALTEVGQNPHDTFEYLYRSMGAVKQFGRLGRFDYVTMLGKLGIAPVEPGSAYLSDGATGPLYGARLLVGGSVSAEISAMALDKILIELDQYLEVGLQTLEDALCNWQKSPKKYVHFKG